MRLAAALALAAVLGATGAACGGGGRDREGSSVAERRASATLRLGQFDWSAARVTNALLAELVRRHPELGIQRVETLDVSPQEGWERLRDGGVDVLTEVYLPNQESFVAEAQGAADLVHRVYGGAVNAWWTPRYAVEDGGPADGLRSVDQLGRYAGVFGRTLYDGDPGWVTTEYNEQRLEGYGLDFGHVTGSERDLIGELRSAYRVRRPILLYLWRPHWAHSRFDLVELEEPNGYSSDCFDGDRLTCAMPTNDVWVAARLDLRRRAPAVWRLLTRFELSLADLEAMMLEVEDRARPPAVVARRWVDRHPAVVARWLGP